MHIRYKFPLESSQSSSGNDAIKPYAFVDKITVRINTARQVRITGREIKPNFIPNYRWINVRDRKVGIWASGLKKEAFLTFSPSTLDSGFNIFPYRGDVLASVQGVLPELLKSLPGFPLMRPELNLLRAGYSELSEIHVTADFSFSSRQKLMGLVRELKKGWKGRRTRKTNDLYVTGLYVNHVHWTLLAYVKDDEIDENHSDWPDEVKRRCRHRLRLEIKLRRQELLRLGHRLRKKYPDLPILKLSQVGDWEPPIYPLVFDLYAARIKPPGQKLIRGTGQQIPLFELISSYGGLPACKRGIQSEVSFYKSCSSRQMFASHNLIVRADPRADYHLSIGNR